MERNLSRTASKRGLSFKRGEATVSREFQLIRYPVAASSTVASQESLESGSVPKRYVECNSVLNVGTTQIITCILLQHL